MESKTNPGGSRRIAIAIATLLVLATSAMAQQSRVYREGGLWVQETTGSIPAPKMLRVNTVLGNVTVQGGNSPDVAYSVKTVVRIGDEAMARALFRELRISAMKQGETAVLTATGPSHFHAMTAEFSLQVPRALSAAKVSTRGGNVAVKSVAGHVEASTGGGSLLLDDIGGTIHAGTGGGNVDVGNVRGDVMAATGGGNVRVQSAAGRITTETAGGNISIGSGQAMSVTTGGGQIDVRQCSGELQARSAGGSLDLGSVAGKAKIETGGGSIRLANANGPVMAQTGGGSIDLRGLAQGARVSTGGGPITAEFLSGDFNGSVLETPSGDIIVYLSPQLKATVHAVIDIANGHRIRSDFSSIQVRSEGGQYGPRTTIAEGQLNGGGPTLVVHTTTGDIEFRKSRK